MSAPAGRRPRRFTILDGLVLTAATAVALRFMQKVMGSYDADFGDPMSVIQNARLRGFWSAPVYLLFWFEIAAPFLLCWGLALAILRFVPPRPGRRRWRPGSAAVRSVAGSVLAMGAGWGVLVVPLWTRIFVARGAIQPEMYGLAFRSVVLFMMAAGASVAASWLSLAIDRRCRRSADWIDRLGLVLGVLCLVELPFMMWAGFILI